MRHGTDHNYFSKEGGLDDGAFFVKLRNVHLILVIVAGISSLRGVLALFPGAENPSPIMGFSPCKVPKGQVTSELGRSEMANEAHPRRECGPQNPGHGMTYRKTEKGAT